MEENNAISRVKKSIITFVILTFALSSIFYYLIIFSSFGGLNTLLLMWCPAIAAIITSLIFFRSIRGFGWGPGKIKYLILGYIIPIVYAIIAYGLFWILGLGTFTGDLPNNIILFVIVGTISGVISALGEEIGWRGFLVPQLAKLTTFTWVAIISGVIWALWHFPLIIFSNYNSATPLWYALPLFFVATLGISFILAWLRLKSGSIWPAVLLHASHNLFIQQFFDPLSSGSLTKYLVGETGVLLVAIIIIFALVFWMMRDKLPDIRITPTQT
ncbi:MAG: CPBP family glutamic-type intramembrane protease [Methanobacterium sp.]